jgi:hypothetical protein
MSGSVRRPVECEALPLRWILSVSARTLRGTFNGAQLSGGGTSSGSDAAVLSGHWIDGEEQFIF